MIEYDKDNSRLRMYGEKREVLFERDFEYCNGLYARLAEIFDSSEDIRGDLENIEGSLADLAEEDVSEEVCA